MLIFTERERTDESVQAWSEPSFMFLDRSARPSIARVRAAIESWAGKYPTAELPSLRGNFRSRHDAQHEGALFELLLHELLLTLGCTVDLHPPMPATRNTPDFLIHTPKDHDFYLEATVCGDHPDPQAESRMSDLRDALDRMAVPGVMFDLRYDGLPEQPISSGPIRKTIAADLAKTEMAVMRVTAEAGDWSALPSWFFQYPGVELHISAFPIASSESALPKRAVGISMPGVRILETDMNLRDTVLDKAGRYGLPELPFIVAVNMLGDFAPEEIDIFNALFGKEATEVGLTEDGRQVQREIRIRDGVWVGPTGLRNRRVSGVLVGAKAGPGAVGERALQLVTNPQAYHPYDCELTILDRWVTKDDGATYSWIAGESLGALLGLPEGWPLTGAS